MRTAACTVAGLLLAAPLAAQQPPARPMAAPAGPQAPAPALNPNDQLDALLMQWEQRMKAVETLVAYPCSRVEKDAVDGTTREFHGYAKFMRPNLADLHMARKDKPELFERYLSTGTFLYEYRPQQKLVRVHDLPQRGPGQGPVEDNFLSFLFGMEAREAKRRYELTLEKTDKWYYYLLVKPRFAPDRADFTVARLALWVNTLLPREMVFVTPNGTEVKWDIPQIDTTAGKVKRSDFQPQRVPADWQTVKVPLPGPPPAAPAPGANIPGAAPAPGANIPGAAPPPSKVRPAGQ
jgi:TIGR03009 family protein